MPQRRALTLPDEAATAAAGARVARALDACKISPFVVYLRGDLGSGKTTFARGFLAACGHTGRVPSPTYTLIEPYEFGALKVYHVDLYRLEIPDQVRELAIAELSNSGVTILIEWPERGCGELPAADLVVSLAVDGAGRRATYTARSAGAEALLARI